MTDYKFLDYNGLDHFWDKIKAYVQNSFLVDVASKEYSISANGTVSDTIDVSKTGYTPIALAGFNVGNATVAVQRCDLWSDQTVHFTVKNLTSSSANSTFYVKVTYVANS